MTHALLKAQAMSTATGQQELIATMDTHTAKLTAFEQCQLLQRVIGNQLALIDELREAAAGNVTTREFMTRLGDMIVTTELEAVNRNGSS